MEENRMGVTQEELKELTIEELVDLKVETENLIEDIDELLEKCDELINS